VKIFNPKIPHYLPFILSNNERLIAFTSGIVVIIGFSVDLIGSFAKISPVCLFSNDVF
jgi:hypothetical protein